MSVSAIAVDARPAPSATTMRQWGIVGVLLLAAILNSADRSSLAIAAPALSRELLLTPVEMGFLLSAFFWTYAVGQVVAGWFTDRFPVLWVFTIGFVLWSGATFCTGLVQGLTTLLVLRLLLGAGESVAFPCYSKIFATEFPPAKQGLPNAILNSGTKIGAALGVLVGGILIALYSWRAMFFVLGGSGVVFLILWFILAPRTDRKPHGQAAATASGGRPTYLDILRNRDAWGTFVGAACYNYAYFFGLTWLPSYLVQQKHLSLEKMGIIGAVPFWAAAVSAIIGGWTSDALIKKGYSTTKVRKAFVASGLVFSVAAYPSALVEDLTVSLMLLTIAYAALGVTVSNLWAISQTLAGPPAAGKWSGAQNCLGAVAGIVAPIVSGFVVQKTGDFSLAFLIMAILALVGAASYVFLVRTIAPIDWARGAAGAELSQAA
jgi:ACS family D-galactonate transporter-like MFS transporter